MKRKESRIEISAILYFKKISSLNQKELKAKSKRAKMHSGTEAKKNPHTIVRN